MLCGVPASETVEYEVERGEASRWIVRVALLAIGFGVLSIALRWFTTHRLAVNSTIWIAVCCALALHARYRMGRPLGFSADADVIRRPGVLPNIRWSDVDHVNQPTQWSNTVVVVLDDGREKRTGFPPEYAERLAEVGGKELR